MRKHMIAIAAAAVLGAATMSTAAMAQHHGGGGAGFGGGGGAHMGGGGGARWHTAADLAAALRWHTAVPDLLAAAVRALPGRPVRAISAGTRGNFAGTPNNFAAAHGNFAARGFDRDHDGHRHFRGFGFGGLYAFSGPDYYDDNAYDDSYGDSCWQRQLVPTPYGLQWQLVDVCE